MTEATSVAVPVVAAALVRTVLAQQVGLAERAMTPMLATTATLDRTQAQTLAQVVAVVAVRDTVLAATRELREPAPAVQVACA